MEIRGRKNVGQLKPPIFNQRFELWAEMKLARLISFKVNSTV